MAQSSVEVIKGAERRRRFSDEEKDKIISASLEPGANVSNLARQYGISPSLLFRWRREYREKNSSDGGGPSDNSIVKIPEGFARVKVDDAGGAAAGPVFIHYGDDIVVEFPESIDPRRLVAFAKALRDSSCGQ